MSIISVHIHFHDGELTKLAAYFVDGYVAAARCVLQKASGNYEASQRRYHEAIKNMALMKKYLTPEQKETILHALRLYVVRLSLTFLLLTTMLCQSALCKNKLH
jgi:hypothetical protein